MALHPKRSKMLRNTVMLLSVSAASSNLWFEDEIAKYQEQKPLSQTSLIQDFTSRKLHSEARAACQEDAAQNEENLEEIGVECECKRRREGIVLICVDECAYCNEDETVCGLQSAQAFYEHDTGERSAIGGIFEYVTGLRDTIAVENLGCIEENGAIVSCDSCNVYANGEMCNSCELIDCGNGLRAESLDCENIESGATYNFCEPVQIEEGVFQALSTEGFEECLPLDVLGKGSSSSSKSSKKGNKRGKGGKGKGGGQRGGGPSFGGGHSSGGGHRDYSSSSKSAKKRKSRRGLLS